MTIVKNQRLLIANYHRDRNVKQGARGYILGLIGTATIKISLYNRCNYHGDSYLQFQKQYEYQVCRLVDSHQ